MSRTKNEVIKHQNHEKKVRNEETTDKCPCGFCALHRNRAEVIKQANFVRLRMSAQTFEGILDLLRIARENTRYDDMTNRQRNAVDILDPNWREEEEK